MQARDVECVGGFHRHVGHLHRLRVHDILGQLFEPSRRNGPLLIGVLWDAALFTAKEAFVGLLLGAAFGFALGVLLAHSGLLQRGFLPYIVASQTIPILAVAPMVVVWVNPRLPDSLKDWGAVAAVSATAAAGGWGEDSDDGEVDVDELERGDVLKHPQLAECRVVSVISDDAVKVQLPNGSVRKLVMRGFP